jgi:DNA polymerase-1
VLGHSRNGSGYLVPDAVNWDSPKQVLDLLQHRGLTLTKTDAETLAPLASADPVIPLLLDYREAQKRARTYGVAWLDNAVHPLTGRIHADYVQCGSVAGRMACSDPNVQNLPRTPLYRGAITAPPGSCLVKCDLSQIELRIAAVLAEDTVMLTAYQTGEDLHQLTAAHLLGVPREQVTAEGRQLAKAVNFGLLYGMGARGLQTYAYQGYRVAMTAAEAQRYRNTFFWSYPGLARWHAETKATAPTETRTLTGRRRRDVTTFTRRLNSPVQGTGADGIKWTLARLFAHRHEVPDARLAAVVHDEVVAECPVEAANETAAWLQRHMVAAMDEVLGGTVPVVADVTIGKDWAGTPL